MAEIESLTIVGASTNPEKFGHQVLQKAIREGKTFYAVNPNAKEITVTLDDSSERVVPTYATIDDIPSSTSHAFFYIPRGAITEEHAAQCERKGIPEIVIPPRSDGAHDPDDEETVKIVKFFTDHNYQRAQIIIDACYVRNSRVRKPCTLLEEYAFGAVHG